MSGHVLGRHGRRGNRAADARAAAAGLRYSMEKEAPGHVRAFIEHLRERFGAREIGLLPLLGGLGRRALTVDRLVGGTLPSWEAWDGRRKA